VDKHAVQSSTLGGGIARLAIDGSRNATLVDGLSNSVSSTNKDAQAWWQVGGGRSRGGFFFFVAHFYPPPQVNLGGNNFISNITIFNRDSSPERLSNFFVLVSQQPFASSRLQDLLLDPFVDPPVLFWLLNR
jgi:hypothetical protein